MREERPKYPRISIVNRTDYNLEVLPRLFVSFPYGTDKMPLVEEIIIIIDKVREKKVGKKYES